MWNYLELSWFMSVLTMWLAVIIIIEIIMLFFYIGAKPPHRSPQPFTNSQIEKINYFTSELDSTILEIIFMTRIENKKNPPKIIFTRKHLEIKSLSTNINSSIPYNQIINITYGRRKPIAVLNFILIFGSLFFCVIATLGPFISTKNAVEALVFLSIMDLIPTIILIKNYTHCKLIYVDLVTAQLSHIGFTTLENQNFGINDAQKLVAFLKEKISLYKQVNFSKNEKILQTKNTDMENEKPLIEVLAELHNLGMMTDEEFAKKSIDYLENLNKSNNVIDPVKAMLLTISQELLDSLSPPKLHKVEKYLKIMEPTDIIVLHDNTIKLIGKERWEGILASGHPDKFKVIYRNE